MTQASGSNRRAECDRDSIMCPLPVFAVPTELQLQRRSKWNSRILWRAQANRGEIVVRITRIAKHLDLHSAFYDLSLVRY